tara:strand:- start:20 stop:133 length:114 start_codon:yes stop_codon:yes gene_type:complete
MRAAGGTAVEMAAVEMAAVVMASVVMEVATERAWDEV